MFGYPDSASTRLYRADAVLEGMTEFVAASFSLCRIFLSPAHAPSHDKSMPLLVVEYTANKNWKQQLNHPENVLLKKAIGDYFIKAIGPPVSQFHDHHCRQENDCKYIHGQREVAAPSAVSNCILGTMRSNSRTLDEFGTFDEFECAFSTRLRHSLTVKSPPCSYPKVLGR